MKAISPRVGSKRSDLAKIERSSENPNELYNVQNSQRESADKKSLMHMSIGTLSIEENPFNVDNSYSTKQLNANLSNL